MTDDNPRDTAAPGQPPLGQPPPSPQPSRSQPLGPQLPAGPMPDALLDGRLPVDHVLAELVQRVLDDVAMPEVTSTLDGTPILGYLRQVTDTELAEQLDNTFDDLLASLVYREAVIDEILRRRPPEATERGWQRVQDGLKTAPPTAIPPPAAPQSHRPPRARTTAAHCYRPRKPR